MCSRRPCVGSGFACLVQSLSGLVGPLALTITNYFHLFFGISLEDNYKQSWVLYIKGVCQTHRKRKKKINRNNLLADADQMLHTPKFGIV